MGKAISETLINEMIELYKKGMPITHIAKELCIDKVTVHKYLSKRGVKTVDPDYSKKSGSRLTEVQREEIITLYYNGVQVSEIAEKVGCSLPTLYTYINKQALPNQFKR